MCVLVPRPNSGRLAVYSYGCVKQYMETFRFKVLKQGHQKLFLKIGQPLVMILLPSEMQKSNFLAMKTLQLS